MAKLMESIVKVDLVEFAFVRIGLIAIDDETYRSKAVWTGSITWS